MSNEPEPDERIKTPAMILMRRLAACVLIVGLSASAIVLATASAEADEDDAGFYTSSVNSSKKYRGDLERIGGKAAVAAAEFNEWFDGLWHGRRLAGTLAALSIGASLLCFLASRVLPPDE
ncbi:MAG: hypothetical protein D4R84_10940 [Rhodocyclaceae bacterium]|nr:MAG: hypothetical protein D4R84_10940 [Rhodocyclaceae bacterium]